jgi:hypothetical protein
MAFRIELFDVWQAGYAGASVAVYVAGTTTLASLYYDEALTLPAANPQTLLSLSSGGVNYGKFAEPIYLNSAYTMVINSTDETGIIRPPVTDLDGQDASDATVIPTGGTIELPLDDIAGRVVHVTAHGQFLPTSNPSASSSTNAATLAAAIGRAAALGGGEVEIPAGTFAFTTLSISAGVMLRGQGRDVTTLQSSQASTVITLAGDRAGFSELTLDGVSKQAGSVGVYAKKRLEPRIEHATVKRFETGVHFRGVKRGDIQDLYVDNCATGAKWHGDSDASLDGLGDDLMFNRWSGGLVSNCTTLGLHLKYVDRKCWHNGVDDVGFENNTGTALKIEGARWTDLNGCWFDGNTTDLHIMDEATTVVDGSNQVVGFHMKGGRIDANMTLTGRLQDVCFERVAFESGTYSLNAPTNAALILDCTEGDITLGGTDTTKWTRRRSALDDYPGSFGQTTNNVATSAWSYNLAPGELINIEAVVLAKGINHVDYAMYHIARSARRPGSTLAYDNQTANFTVGDIITGGTSGASARVVADADAGATGTLTCTEIAGEMLDNEIITGALGGSAQVNGTFTHQNAALVGATTSIEAAVETVAAYACDFAASGDEIHIQVTGDTGDTTDWTVSAKVTSSG